MRKQCLAIKILSVSKNSFKKVWLMKMFSLMDLILCIKIFHRWNNFRAKMSCKNEVIFSQKSAI